MLPEAWATLECLEARLAMKRSQVIQAIMGLGVDKLEKLLLMDAAKERSIWRDRAARGGK